MCSPSLGAECPIAFLRYNILLTAAGRARDLARVDAVLDEMRSSGLPPDETTHGAVVSALVRCGQLQRAADALLEAQRGTPPPGVRAYTALVQGDRKSVV